MLYLKTNLMQKMFSFVFLAHENLNCPILPALENGSDVPTVKLGYWQLLEKLACGMSQ